MGSSGFHLDAVLVEEEELEVPPEATAAAPGDAAAHVSEAPAGFLRFLRGFSFWCLLAQI